MKNALQKKLQEILDFADIEINSDRPRDIHVHDERFFSRVLAEWSMGLGESFMDGWRDCEDLSACLTRIFRANLQQKIKPNLSLLRFTLKAKLLNLQKKSNSSKQIAHHYDIGNDLYEKMLDQRMIYSCGYRKSAQNLDDAQEDKLDLICKKLQLKPGMSVLDIGCGRGGFAKFAAEKYDVSVTGITLSTEQAKLAQEKCKNFPIEIRIQDYRDLQEKFDRVLSIGMFEHIGHKNYEIYMKTVAKNLKKNGLSLLHTIGANVPSTHINQRIDKYIFPGAVIPALSQIASAAQGKFVIEDCHNFGPSYDKTLMARHKNFQTHRHEIKEKYGEKFRRMREFYLLSSAATFRSRHLQLRQIVLSPDGSPDGYTSIR